MPTIAEVQTRRINAGTCYSTLFSIDLTVLRQLVCFQVLATLSGRCFLLIFTWDIFGQVVCKKLKNWVSFLICRFFSLYSFWNVSLQICYREEKKSKKCLPSWKWSSKWLHKGPQHRGGMVGVCVVLVFTKATCSHTAPMVFYACKCFVFWSRRKDTWTESQA